MQTIEVTTPYIFAGSQVEKITLEPLTFVKVQGMAPLAELMTKTNGTFQGNFRTLRMKEAMTLYTADGKSHKPEHIHISMMPPRIGRDVAFKVDGEAGDEPTVLSDGNGIDTPILIKLGTPIGVTNTGGEASSGIGDITELEFHAKTFGQIESVLAESDNMLRTIELIKSACKPAGMLALPEWAIDKLSLSDGLYIMNEIVPRFLS